MTEDHAVIGSLGELLVEFVATEKNGRHQCVGAYTGPFPSGAPGIFIDQAARLGASTIFAGAVGDDAFGAVIRDRLESAGVSPALLRTVAGVPTGSAFVSYNDDGSRDFVFNIAHSAASHFPTGNEAVAGLREFGTRVFHISGSTLGNAVMAEAALDICRALHDEGVRISFDPNIRKELLGEPRYGEVVGQLTQLASYFLPSVEDAAVLFPGEAFESYAERLLAAGADYVVLKRGEEGCMGMALNGVSASLPAHAVSVVDPTGAGDCFCATFVALIAAGRHDFRAALEYANAAGALAVGRLGPMEGNSSPAEIEAFLARAQ